MRLLGKRRESGLDPPEADRREIVVKKWEMSKMGVDFEGDKSYAGDTKK